MVHDEHPSRLRGRVGAPLQDANGILVIPVVEDAREDVAARSGGERIEKLPTWAPARWPRPAEAMACSARATGPARSITVPRRPSWARRMAISKLALPPPRSTT